MTDKSEEDWVDILGTFRTPLPLYELYRVLADNQPADPAMRAAFRTTSLEGTERGSIVVVSGYLAHGNTQAQAVAYDEWVTKLGNALKARSGGFIVQATSGGIMLFWNEDHFEDASRGSSLLDMLRSHAERSFGPDVHVHVIDGDSLGDDVLSQLLSAEVGSSPEPDVTWVEPGARVRSGLLRGEVKEIASEHGRKMARVLWDGGEPAGDWLKAKDLEEAHG